MKRGKQKIGVSAKLRCMVVNRAMVKLLASYSNLRETYISIPPLSCIKKREMIFA